MDVENETRPLLTSFENESWRSKARKRCMRIPSEVTITGIILGLFLIVVTLLIVLENMETENKDSISLGNNLLASPFKYNKKTEDKTWQDKKDNMKNKIINKELKWDKVNKGWKQFPDISGKIENNGIKVLQKNWKDDIEKLEIPEVVDEYGKETDNSLEAYLNLQMSDSSSMQMFNKDASDIKNLIQSKIKWKQIDDGWKKLSEQGWSDKSIRIALFKAIKERRKELLDAANVLQSPVKLDQIWDNIIEVWKKNVKEGNEDADYLEMEDKEKQYHKNINEQWKNEMNILQSPKSDIKKFVKDDSGWQKLSEQGWKNKDIEGALVEAFKEKENVLQSPMKIQNLWEKATNFFKNLVQKGIDEQKSQKEINDDWAKKFNILQSPIASDKKWGKNDEPRKKHFKDDSKDKTENETDETLKFPINFEDFLEDIIESIKVQKGMKEPKSQKEINDKFAKEFNLLQSSMSFYKDWKIIDELRKKHSKDEENNKDTDKANDEKDQLLQSPTNFEDFTEHIIEKIKEQKKGWKDKDLKEAVYNSWKDDGKKLILSATGYNNMKWKKVNEGWKKISNKS